MTNLPPDVVKAIVKVIDDNAHATYPMDTLVLANVQIMLLAAGCGG
jgi:hypothetical protein